VYQRIVVALDGSELAERGLRHAVALARAVGAPLHLVRVATITRLNFAPNEAAADFALLTDELGAQQEEAHAYLAKTREGLGEASAAATTEVRTGVAGTQIVAASRPGDLIVIASHGRGGVARWLLGSVAEEVTRHARVPVLLYRAGDEETKRDA